MNTEEKIISNKYALAFISSKTEIDKKIKQLSIARDLLFPYLKQLSHPCLNNELKFELLLKILGKDFENTNVHNFLKLLIKQKRIKLLDNIILEIIKIKDKLSNILEVEVFSAYEINDKENLEIEKILSKYMGKKIKIKKNIDKSLIAGLLIKYEDIVIDGTLKNRLKKLKQL